MPLTVICKRHFSSPKKQIAIILLSHPLFVEGFVLSINQRKDASLRSDYVLNKVNDRLVGFTYFSDSLLGI